MDTNTAQVLAAMDKENFEAYLLAMYQEDEDEGEELSDEVRAYYTYSKGGNTGAQALINLCSKCEEECDDDELQQYYEEMVEDYGKEESLCAETNDGSDRYIGYTCGADGSSIELAVFQDNECTELSDTQDGYNMASMLYNSKNDEEARMIGEMQMMTQMYSIEFSCQMGVDRSQDGGDEVSTQCAYCPCSGPKCPLIIHSASSSTHCRTPTRMRVSFAKTYLPSPFPRMTALPMATTTTRTRERART